MNMKSNYPLNMTRILAMQAIFLCLFFYSISVISAEREYTASMKDSKWISGGQKQYECTMSQTIPFYGEGRFVRKSGHNVAFELYSDDMVLRHDAKVVIQSEPPSWRHDEKVFEIGKFDFEAGHNPLTVKSHHASRMLQQIENGMSPVVIYRDLADGRDIIAVLLSPINFRKALKDYRDCEKTLLDFDIDKTRNLQIYFDTNKHELTKRSKRDLDNVIRYLKIDPKILQLKVTAFSDSRGRRRFNDKLSEMRSESVVNYLLKVGAKKEMIYAVSYGERKADFSNKTASGRAKNRRVDVELLDIAPPSPEEQEAMKQAREEERRRLLNERSVFKDVPKKRASSKKQVDTPEAGSEQAGIESDLPEQSEEEPFDDEPPAPNFINFDHLVDKNNQKVPSQ